MEKIRIGNQETLFEIESIRPVSENVMQLVFPDTMPSVWGDITIYTDDGTEATTLTGYDTVYRDEGQTVYLSNDGSVYTAPETPEGPGEPPEPYIPTLEELQAAKRREISEACQQIIYQGINVPLSDGTSDHFALTIEDQLNLFGKQIQVTSGAVEEVQAIFYGADVPPAYQSEVLQSYLTQIAAIAGGNADGADPA